MEFPSFSQLVVTPCSSDVAVESRLRGINMANRNPTIHFGGKSLRKKMAISLALPQKGTHSMPTPDLAAYPNSPYFLYIQECHNPTIQPERQYNHTPPTLSNYIQNWYLLPSRRIQNSSSSAVTTYHINFQQGNCLRSTNLFHRERIMPVGFTVLS